MTKGRPRPRLADLARMAGAAAALALLSTELVAYARNTPLKHPEWVSTKDLLPYRVMGAHEALMTRNLLQRDRLNLGVWHGFQELLFARPFRAGSLRFRFHVDDSYVEAVFNKDASGASLLRLSQGAAGRSAFFRTDAAGRYLRTETLWALTLAPGWHDASLDFDEAGLRLTVDGKAVVRLDERPLPLQMAGVRGGRAPASVDDVVMTDASGRVVIRENFRNDAHYGRVFASLLALLAAALAAAWRRMSGSPREKAPALVLAQLAACAAVASTLAFDEQFWSGRYTRASHKTTPTRSSGLTGAQLAEEARRALFGLFEPLDPTPEHERRSIVRQEAGRFLGLDPQYRVDPLWLQITRSVRGRPLLESVPSDPAALSAYWASRRPRPERLVVLLGTSQAWGTAARSASDTLQSRLQALLSRARMGRDPVWIINASIRGAESSEVFERYRGRLARLAPALVVVYMTNNDSSADLFRRNLESLIAFNRARGIKMLLVSEPSLADLEEKARLIAGVARRSAVPYFDLRARMADEKIAQSGQLWWDFIHLSSYGQAEAARFLAPPVLALLD